MRPDQSQTPVFGSPDPSIKYKPRLAAYAVITDREGRVAAVEAKYGYFLPGGGALPGETPEQTIEREVREELAREVRIVRQIGEAVQYFCGGGQHYRMEARFFAAKFAGEAIAAGEHELRWLESGEVERAFFHQCHAWAARRRVTERNLRTERA